MFRHLIAGEWVESPRTRRNINPSDTRDVVGEYAQADASQARDAIAAAQAAFGAWAQSTPQQRFDLLDAVGTEILARRAELGDLLAREEGKTLPETSGEVARAGNIVKFVAGAALLADARVAAITFTGSVGTGQQVAAACVARLAKFQLEMGGKDRFVVLDDADLGVAVNCASRSGFFSTGQRCTASSRVIATAGIHDRFVGALRERMKALKVDDARNAGTDIGPVVDDKQLAQDREYLAIGRAEGARRATTSARRCSPKRTPRCASTARRSSARWSACSARATTTKRSRWRTTRRSASPRASRRRR